VIDFPELEAVAEAVARSGAGDLAEEKIAIAGDGADGLQLDVAPGAAAVDGAGAEAAPLAPGMLDLVGGGAIGEKLRVLALWIHPLAAGHAEVVTDGADDVVLAIAEVAALVVVVALEVAGAIEEAAEAVA